MTGGQADPARVIGQVVTGIGFLGAGVMMARDGAVIGVTSAATIWVLAAIAVQAGLDHYWAAIVLSLLTVGILLGVSWLENTFINLQSGVHSHLAGLRRRGDRRAPEEPRE
jgi:putative Mg2+ transporter-C (MgtC) family protein